MARNQHFAEGFHGGREQPMHELVEPVPHKKKSPKETPSSMGAWSIPGNSMGKHTIQEAHYTSSMGAWSGRQ